MEMVEILCLANSRKPPSGRCIAGKRLNGTTYNGEWVRPVSDRDTKEISEEERRYEDGTGAQLLDILLIPLEAPAPTAHQVENIRINDRFYWIKKTKASFAQVLEAIDIYDPNFWCICTSTYHGLNDRVSEQQLINIHSSLKLIIVRQVKIQVYAEPSYVGGSARRRVRANFEYQGRQYSLVVTDREFETKYLGKQNGLYDLNNVVLCVSLAEAWNDYASRVIASVITQDMFQAQ